MIYGPAAISIGNETDVTRDIVFRLFSLAFPCIDAERQAAAENAGSSSAPILVVDLGAVFGGDRVHVGVSFVECFFESQKRFASASILARRV